MVQLIRLHGVTKEDIEKYLKAGHSVDGRSLPTVQGNVEVVNNAVVATFADGKDIARVALMPLVTDGSLMAHLSVGGSRDQADAYLAAFAEALGSLRVQPRSPPSHYSAEAKVWHDVLSGSSISSKRRNALEVWIHLNYYFCGDGSYGFVERQDTSFDSTKRRVDGSWVLGQVSGTEVAVVLRPVSGAREQQLSLKFDMRGGGFGSGSPVGKSTNPRSVIEATDAFEIGRG